MTGLTRELDQVVRQAVADFIEGRSAPGFSGELVFETKNSRYRLIDGILFSAPNAMLIGSEIVGWLREDTLPNAVSPIWQRGARAVLVDRKRRHHIIVTSATRRLRIEGAHYGSPGAQCGSMFPQAPSSPASSFPPPPPSSIPMRRIPPQPPLPSAAPVQRRSDRPMTYPRLPYTPHRFPSPALSPNFTDFTARARA